MNTTDPIGVTGIDHVTLVVADLERSAAFYVDLLGMQRVARPGFNFPGLWFQAGATQIHLILQHQNSGPAGLPKPVVDRLHSAVTEALAQKEVQDAFATHGVTIVGSTPDAAARFFRTELDKHAALVKRSGAVLE